MPQHIPQGILFVPHIQHSEFAPESGTPVYISLRLGRRHLREQGIELVIESPDAVIHLLHKHRLPGTLNRHDRRPGPVHRNAHPVPVLQKQGDHAFAAESQIYELGRTGIDRHAALRLLSGGVDCIQHLHLIQCQARDHYLSTVGSTFYCKTYTRCIPVTAHRHKSHEQRQGEHTNPVVLRSHRLRVLHILRLWMRISH